MSSSIVKKVTFSPETVFFEKEIKEKEKEAKLKRKNYASKVQLNDTEIYPNARWVFQKTCILCNSPLFGFGTDFWRMIAYNKIKIIVMLKDEKLSAPYWTFSQNSIETIYRDRKKEIIKRTLVNPQSEQEVVHYQIKYYVPEKKNSKILKKLIQYVNTEMEKSGKKTTKVVIHPLLESKIFTVGLCAHLEPQISIEEIIRRLQKRIQMTFTNKEYELAQQLV